MRNEIMLVFSDGNQYKFNVGIAVELIKKFLYRNNEISSKELDNVISVANRSVKLSTKID